MICAPDHIKKYVTPIVGKNKYFEDSIYGAFTFAYEVHCSCGGKELTVYKTSEPKVTAVCAACGRMTTIYDLTEYPCAVPLGKEETPAVNAQSIMLVDDETARTSGRGSNCIMKEFGFFYNPI